MIEISVLGFPDKFPLLKERRRWYYFNSEIIDIVIGPWRIRAWLYVYFLELSAVRSPYLWPAMFT